MNLSDVYDELDNFEKHFKGHAYSPRFYPSQKPIAQKELDLITDLKGIVKWPLDRNKQLDEIELFEVTKKLLLINWATCMPDMIGLACRSFNAKQILKNAFGESKTMTLVNIFKTEEFSKAVFYSIIGSPELVNQPNSKHMDSPIRVCV